jgi:hypothetical protein
VPLGVQADRNKIERHGGVSDDAEHMRDGEEPNVGGDQPITPTRFLRRCREGDEEGHAEQLQEERERKSCRSGVSVFVYFDVVVIRTTKEGKRSKKGLHEVAVK